MVALEITLLTIGIAAVISSIDFIAKTTSNITHSLGINEYLVSTTIISFMVSVPSLLVLLFSNFYNFPDFGIHVLIGFAITIITFVLGVFLLTNEVPLVYEGHRNATFMWASTLLLFIVAMDSFIDRMDAIFLMIMFGFYVLYILYRASKTKEYVFLRRIKAHIIVYPLAVFTIITSSLLVFSTSINLTSLLNWQYPYFCLVIIGPLFAIPVIDVIKTVFNNAQMIFDNIMGNIVVSTTLIPGVIAIFTPIPLVMYNKFDFIPFIILNLVCLSFAAITRLRRSIHRKTGILLILTFCGYLLYILLSK